MNLHNAISTKTQQLFSLVHMLMIPQKYNKKRRKQEILKHKKSEDARKSILDLFYKFRNSINE